MSSGFRRVISAALGLALGSLAGAPDARAQGFGGKVSDHLVRGESLLAQGRPNEAMVQFQEARTLCATPAEDVTSRQGEAQALLALNQLLPAAGLFEEAATLFPDDPRAPDLLFNAGLARLRAGEIEKAIDLMRRCLARSPTPDLLPMAKYQLAQAYRTTGQPEQVIAVLKDFETGSPGHRLLPNVLYSLAIANHDLFTGRGDHQKLTASEAIYRSLIERYPQSMAATEAHFELAWVLADEGRAAEAAELYQAYVTRNPASPVAAAALERAADLLLFRSPKQGRTLYALAVVKANANPKPPLDTLQLSGWLPLKKAVAEALSRPWVVGILGLSAAALFGAGARWLLLRRRRAGRSAASPKAGRPGPAGRGPGEPGSPQAEERGPAQI
jgi:tetratricopeptide (TPR) repeat protein